MQTLNSNPQPSQLPQNMREVQEKMVRQIEKGRFYGLDQQIRQIQRQIQVLSKI